MIGADVVARELEANKLKRVYTFPGGTVAPVYDALKKRDIDIFCAIHEQGAGYAALAEARLTRRPQVVIVTSGPGVTNIATVVADAYFDSTPLIVIMGQVGTGDITSPRKVRQCGFQQVDAISIMKPIAKAAFSPMKPDDLPEILGRAFALATEGRHGPVVIDLPMDVQRGHLEKMVEDISFASEEKPLPEKCLMDEIALEIAGAQRPVILAGQGVLAADACEELRTLSESCNIPVVMSLLGLGAVPSDSHLSLGFAGHTGNQYAARAVHEADLLLVVGARLDVRQTGTCTDQFVPGGRVVRIDLDESELMYPRVNSDINIHADAKTALSMLNKYVKNQVISSRENWLDRMEKLKSDYPLSFDSTANGLKPQEVVETVNRLTKDRRVVVTSGVGSHQQWAARHFHFDYPRRAWLTSGGHGAMGYDLPAAVGAQISRPDDCVICFVGDGSFQINIQELQSLVVNNLPVKIFVMDNSRLALVSQFQMLNWDSDPTTGEKSNPDFASIAKAYGIKSFAAKNREELQLASREALVHDGPALVHVLMDKNEDVSPMLLADQTMDKMWSHE